MVCCAKKERVRRSTLGRDSEWALAAAANAVRAMREAGHAEEAQRFAQEWKVADEENPDEFARMQQGVEDALEQVWKGVGAKGSLDPAGFLRDQGLGDSEAVKFVEEWEVGCMKLSVVVSFSFFI